VTGIMLLVTGLTVAGLYLAQRKVAGDAQHDLQQDFQAELAAMHNLQGLRHAELVERCRVLVSRPRIHAALEDNALDLLYPSAKDELRDLMQDPGKPVERSDRALRTRFYRFLDRSGHVLPAPVPEEVGLLSADSEKELALAPLPASQQLGYVAHADAAQTVDEILAVPIFSSETGEVISALVIGFEPLQVHPGRLGTAMASGIWLGGQLYLPALSHPAARSLVAREVASRISGSGEKEGSFSTSLEGVAQLVFFKRLNPGSAFPPAYEVCAYPLGNYQVRQRRLVWEIVAAGLALLLLGFAASQMIARRLSAPVEKLAVDFEQQGVERRRAEIALESTSEELERTARYSADASHQLKSPVTVMRAGLETLLARDDLKPEVYEELSTLVHQTYRLTGVIDDLLLLARVDAGHLRVQFSAVSLSSLVEQWLDDLSAMPDALDLTTVREFPSELCIAGERRYASLIVQNLLENARKYNRPGGTIRIKGVQQGQRVILTVGNTGHGISPEARSHLFNRFHRGSSTDGIPGHGLGLNLARELARLHGGDLRLVSSAEDWTEFEVQFQAASEKTIPPSRVVA
jgi:signal transduction histidine kinase